MKLPNLAAGAVRNHVGASRRAQSSADAIVPQLIYCFPCEENPEHPGKCSRECCLFKYGEEINCWTRPCPCH